MNAKMTQAKTTSHHHGWIVGILGLVLGISLLVVFPKFKAVAGVVLLIALFHLVGGAIILGSLYSFAPKRFARLTSRFRKNALDEKEYNFGWSWGAISGPWFASAAFLTIAFGLQLEFPWLWPVWFVIALLGLSFFVGGILFRMPKRIDFASLPLVDLLRSENDLVLDAGCGAGRTTIALSKVLKKGTVIALDRFDAYYIDGGGRALLEQNLRSAGLTEQVKIEEGDLSRLSFPDAYFDSAVSAHVFDHLKQQKKAALTEMYRVLKPGGRFLMVVWVPGWATFSLANAFCLFLTSKTAWRQLANTIGFSIQDEGTFNGMWFTVLEKPE